MLTVEQLEPMKHVDLDIERMKARVERLVDTEHSQVVMDFHSLLNEIVFLRTRHDLRGVALKLVIEQLKQV